MSADSFARPVDLLEELVAIPSVTGEESALTEFVARRCLPRGWTADWMEVTPGRRNVFLHRGAAQVVFMTHADTVPPFAPPRRESGVLYGRGACDAKASLAAMAVAVSQLAEEGAAVGLLLLVGEEKGSDGALAANRRAPQARFIVGGEPTGNRFIAGGKGALRITASAVGVAGHSSQVSPPSQPSQPGSSRSAVLPLLDFLADLRQLSWPKHPVFGETTANIGVLRAGTAPNVIAEEACAEVLFRTGVPVDDVLAALAPISEGRVRLEVPYRSEPIAFRLPRGLTGDIVAFACDLPLLPAWGEPILVGPGSIADAHGALEKVALDEVEAAVPLYVDLAHGLLARAEEYLEPRAAFMEHSRPVP
jgi:acetylornithine deacetylase/succinyl-diaminopimelate desuccinylase-like protein